MNTAKTFASAAGIALVLAFAPAYQFATAADDAVKKHDHSDHVHDMDDVTAKPAADTQPAAAETPATKDYREAMEKMHKDMSIPYTGDVDVDFVRGMMPHHQGAIDQAQVLLKHSKNLRLRRLAGGIIAAQRREIRFMQQWLKEHDAGVTNDEMPDWLKNQPDKAE